MKELKWILCAILMILSISTVFSFYYTPSTLTSITGRVTASTYSMSSASGKLVLGLVMIFSIGVVLSLKYYLDQKRS